MRHIPTITSAYFPQYGSGSCREPLITMLGSLISCNPQLFRIAHPHEEFRDSCCKEA
jgi:hypothetical protein